MLTEPAAVYSEDRDRKKIWLEELFWMFKDNEERRETIVTK